MSGWTSAADIRARLRREWEQGRILAAHLGSAPVFPWVMRLKTPTNTELAEAFAAVREWIRDLQRASQSSRSFDLAWQEINHRQLGRNQIPVRVNIENETVGLRLIGKEKEAARFDQLAADILARFPALQPWLAKRPLLALENYADWPRLLAVLDWFCQHPRPDIYLRQIDISGIDTKFIETRKGLLAELLDAVLPGSAIDADCVGARGFELRYGFKSKPAQVRFRLLDARLYLCGLSDLVVPAEQFARLDWPVKRVFITENEINGLAFPDKPDSLVIFGLGYALDRLAESTWLADKEIIYWGDIDTHGFAMLDRLRSYFPQVRSLLMDSETLLAHRDQWGCEGTPHHAVLPRLTDAEAALYQDLCSDTLAPRLRLEQEHIRYGWLRERLIKPDCAAILPVPHQA